MSKTLEKEEVYRAKIFDSLRSLCLTLLARPIYSLEYKDNLEMGEVYKGKNVFPRSLEKQYSSSESSSEGKTLKLSLIYLIIFSQCICNLAGNTCHFF